MTVITSVHQQIGRIDLMQKFDFHIHRDFKHAYTEMLGNPAIHEIEIGMQHLITIDSAALGMLVLLRDQAGALPAVLHMLAVGLTCTLAYKLIKGKTLRPRPFDVHPGIVCVGKTLDQFSFPSGHTLHAVAFSIVAVAYYPALAWLVWPFTLLVGMSRPILGLHYPSDVFAGALLGGVIASASLYL